MDDRTAKLELKNAVDLLRRARPYLERHGFDRPVGNDMYCVGCGTSGSCLGEAHKPDCPGVRLLKEIDETIAAIG